MSSSVRHSVPWDSGLVRTLDRTRWHVLKALAPLAGRLAGDRDRRVWWLGLLTVAAALALVVALPRWALWSPLVLGVPHLVADLRYLVVQPRLHRRAWSAIPGVLVVVAGLWSLPAVVGLATATVAVFARGSALRRGLLAAASALSAVLALRAPLQATLVLAFLHNLLAVALWWAWRPRAPRMLGVLAALVGGVLLLASGAGDWVASRLSVAEAASWDGLGLPLPAGRVLALFLFLQAVHYGVWLRLVPEDARSRPAPRPLARSLAALEADLGRAGLLVAAGACVAVLGWGVVDAHAARSGYLWLASFHGGLEVAVGALWVVEGRPR